MKTATELKQIAKKRLIDNLAVAYYGFESDDDFQNLTEEERERVYKYLDKYAEAMAKAINEKYYSM